MSAAVRSSSSLQAVAWGSTKCEVSLFRLYTLRAAYFAMAVVLGAFV